MPGQALIAQSASRMQGIEGLEATIRQQVNLFGTKVIGDGRYLQAAATSRTFPARQLDSVRFRLELKFIVASKLASLLQVSDGRILWSRTDFPNNQRLVRIDLRRIRKAQEAYPQADPAQWQAGQALHLNGIPGLMLKLHREFEFGEAEPTQVGSTPVWLVRGQWKPERLETLVPPEKKMPPQFPTSVSLVLARDPKFALFPLRIAFERRDPSGRLVPITVFEFYEVAFRSVEPFQFEYNPLDQEVEDRTDELIRQIDQTTNVRQADIARTPAGPRSS